MKFVRRSDGREVLIDPSLTLGAGGEARVFVLPSDEAAVAKIYRRPTDQHMRKLAVMLANPPDDPMAAQGHVSIAWPFELLNLSDGTDRTVGFLMPRATGTRPLIDFYNPATRRRVCPLFNPLYLLRTARNLSAAVHAVHSRGYVVGDINESNILVTDTSLVTMVDTDSFQVRDPETGHMYRCPVGKPEFTPPELQGEVFREIDRAPEHDRFGLAVLIFQLLMEGTHPYAGLYTEGGDPPPYAQRIQDGHFQYGTRRVPFRPMPVAPAFDILPPDLRELFIRCFEAGHADPAARPDAETWVSALQEAEGNLSICRVNDQHRYSRHLTSCPWCARRIRFGGRDPFPSKEVVRRGEHLKPAEPTQASLPSATNIVPAAPPPPRDPVVSVPPPPPDSVPNKVPEKALNLHPANPVAAPRPAITAVRGATRPASVRPRGMVWTLLFGLVAISVMLVLFGVSFAQKRDVNALLVSARTALTTAQSSRSGLRGDAVTLERAGTLIAEVKTQVRSVMRDVDGALNKDRDNREAAAIRDQAGAAERGAEADYEALQAKTLLDEVVSSIDRYKDEDLTQQEADAVRNSLRDKCRSALAHCERALSLDPQTPAAWVQRVRAHRLSGNPSAARAGLRDALSRFPGDVGLLEQEALLRGE
jgi:serine/threonine protein kinase